MSRQVEVRLREVRRGEQPDELFLIDMSGAVTILHAHGVNPDEQLRTREGARRLLIEAIGR
jgi:uncharacterized Rossmann fold enzyme